MDSYISWLGLRGGGGAHFYPFSQVIPPVYSIIKVELIDGI